MKKRDLIENEIKLREASLYLTHLNPLTQSPSLSEGAFPHIQIELYENRVKRYSRKKKRLEKEIAKLEAEIKKRSSESS